MLTIGLIILLLAKALFSDRNNIPVIYTRITVIILIYSALLSINVINFSILASGVSVYGGLFHVSCTTLMIDTFIYVSAAIILIGFKTNQKKYNNIIVLVTTNKEYPLIVLFALLGQSLLISSSDLVSIFLSLELQSFAVYLLSTLYRDIESSTSAGLKYFILGGVSSAVILLGSAVIYNYTGLTQFDNIYFVYLVNSTSIIPNQVILGLVLIGVGFLFKVASAPLHNWAPDVYDGTPTIVTVFISTIPKISLFLFLIELQTGLEGSFSSLTIYTDIFSKDIDIWKNLLLIGSIFSLIIGTVLGLSQYRIKRLLAYSTISHVGFLLLSLLINSEESIESFLFYIMQYSLTNICAFLCLLQFASQRKKAISKKDSNNNNDIQFIHEIKGEFRNNPVLAFSLSMCLFSIAGIPPLIGFFAKQIVLLSSLHAGYYYISFICVVTSVISASYYLKIVKVLYFDESYAKDEDNEKSKKNNSTVNSDTNSKINAAHSLCISVLTVIILLFVFQPQILLNSSKLLALTLFYY